MKPNFPQFSTSLRIALLAALQIPFCFADYAFTRLYSASPAVTEASFSSSTIAINNGGLVAFQSYSAGFVVNLVISSGPGNFTKLPLPANVGTFRITSVNSSGTVAFVARFSDDTIGVYTSSAAGLVQVAVSRNFPVTFPLEYNYANPTINDRGDVSFLSSSFGSPSRIMVKSGGQLKVIADLGKAIPLLGNVNAAGVVAQTVQTGFFDPAEYSVFAQSESSRTAIAKGTDGIYTGVAINDQGTVVFHLIHETGGTAVYTGSGGAVRTVIDNPSFFVSNHVSINNAGTVLMQLSQNSSPFFNGLATGSNLATDKVIGFGDPLFGSTVKGLYADGADEGHAINDQGQIAFRYELANGETGIAIANPGGAGISNLNSATFAANQPIGQDSIVTVQGSKLATQTASPSVSPTFTLAGTSVTITDSAGTARPAPLFFVSPSQINYLMPAGTAIGPATAKVVSGDGTISIGSLSIVAVAPGIYSLNAGRLAAANVLRLRNGAQTYESVYQISGSSVVPLPIDLGPVATDQVYLLLYGTGLRHAASASVLINGSSIPVLFSGAASDYAGLDQINVGPLPRTLIGSGSVDVVVKADSIFANVTNLTMK